MTAFNQDEPINPVPYKNSDGTIQHDVFMGLTKREYFAGLAMQGLLANDFVKLDITANGSEFTNTDMVAQMSVAMADALLKEII